MDTSQPPLARYIIALPLKIFMRINMPQDKSAWRSPDRATFSRDFFYKYNEDPKKIIFLCRIPVMIIGALCGLLLFVWMASLYGARAGLISLFLYCFSPNILAHAGLATTDMISVFFIFLSVYSFWLFLNEPSAKKTFFAALCLGLAQLSKYNAILLYPVFLLLFVFELPKIDVPKMINISAKFGIMIFLSLVVIWAGYGFDFKPILKDAMRVEEKIDMAQKMAPFLSREKLEHALLSVPIPLGSHLLGIMGVLRHGHEGHRAFFLGKWSNGGDIFYFLTAFLIKNPVPMLLLLIMGLFVFVKKGIGRAERVILVTIALYFITSSFGKLQLGIRHILPLFPFCFMIAGRCAELFKKRYLSAIIIALIAWHTCLTIFAWPDYMGYFNEFIGGPKNGYKYLRDSNIDWGQNLPALAEYMNKNGVGEITLAYFGEANPSAYGIKYRNFSPDELTKPGNRTYAVSVQYLESVKWTKDRKPNAIAGSSIFIYRPDRNGL